jgi:hypothetical protein
MDNTCDRCKKEGLGYVNTVYAGNKVFCKSCYSILKKSGEIEKIRKEPVPAK